MKILYVDYFQKDGHVNFNRIHIDALRNAGHQVDLVMHAEIARQLPYPDEDYVLQLPRSLRFRNGKPLLNRVVFLLALLYIRMRVRVSHYDKVFLGCVDEISYNLLPISRDAYIYAHGNGRFMPYADGTPSAAPMKFKALKALAPRATFVVFNDYMAQPFRDAGFPNVKVISHGCVPPFDPADDGTLSELPFAVTSEMKIVFHPSGKCNEDFVRKALAAPALHTFLSANNVHLILRNRPSWADESKTPANIHFVNGFLSNDLYRAIFLRADAILMCYPAAFHHQASGVSYECAANGKLILAYQAPSVEYIRDFYNYDPLFADIPQFIDRLSAIFHEGSECNIIVTPQSLAPDYSHFF